MIPRNIETKIEKLLKIFPVVALIGARQTGKTVLAQKLRPNWRYLDLENPNDFEVISRDPVLYFDQFPSHIIFDEAQRYPELFDVLRGVIDSDRNQKGRFIITGSSSPELLSGISDSLAGRIGIVEIGTLKTNEYYQKPLSHFYNLFEQPLTKDFQWAEPLLSNQQFRTVWLKGGYPEPLLALDDTEYPLWIQAYFDTYINRDIALIFPRLNKSKYHRFINMLAQLSGTIINKSDVGRILEIDESSARDYLSIADKTFIWRELMSYGKSKIKSIVKMPKGHLRDSGLCHFLLGIQNYDALYKSPRIGASFESFVIEELIKGLQATLVSNWQASYYRTRSGAEIDLILEGPFGTLPIEIKYGTTIKLRQLQPMSRFIDEHNLPFGLVINQSKEKMWLTDTILQLPVAYL